ncbi:hypothetical protein LPJ61_001196 [Coemansia biformis]|uniref:PIN domain-like protein n=1 Tax=Coemansia biformis TaxID=1286918 RepID=A0A9W7YI62_9FUNG|nr:hypothetical protein LPJ61_001196 [Coemansia biformis]
MGVQRLMPLLARFAPGCISMPTAKDLSGLVLAMDSNIFVHRFLKGVDGGTDEKRHLRGMHRLATYAQTLGVTPLFVFDGKVPTQGKESELDKRQVERLRMFLELEREKTRAQRVVKLTAISAQLVAECDPSSPAGPDDAQAVAWLKARVQELAADAGRPQQSIAGRMDQLEAAACRELLLGFGAQPGPGYAGGDACDVHGAQALSTLQALSAERVAVLGRRVEPLTDDKIGECVELVAAMGCATHVAGPCEESEGVCAQLCRAGVADAVCSEDLDVVAFGARLLRGFGTPGARAPMVLVDAERAHEELELSREAFVDLCILCGTDFSSTLEKVGPITALRLVREHGSIERILERSAFQPRPGFTPDVARHVFLTNRQPPPIHSRNQLRQLARPADPAAVAALLGGGHPSPDDSRAPLDGTDPFARSRVLP